MALRRFALAPAVLLFPALLGAQAPDKDGLIGQQQGYPVPAAAKAALPEKLTDAEFWKLVGDISEPGGYFQMDNWTSNEMEVGRISTLIRQKNLTGGVYMGVGPEQNFSYMAAVRPKMAFIVDIRRQAVMQHLMYKAIFEMSKDRADFISLLFAKPRPAGLDSMAPIQTIWNAYANVPTDTGGPMVNLNKIKDRLTKVHGFTFTPEEDQYFEIVYGAFYRTGPQITSGGRGGGGRGGGLVPPTTTSPGFSVITRGGGSSGTFQTLTGWSMDDAGQVQSFLSTHDNFAYVKSLHEKNLIVPASGNFGGPKAIRAVGQWLKDHDATVTAFYVSNVEQYLYQDNIFREFYGNVETLPITDKSVFIRPYAMRQFTPEASLCPIGAYIKAWKSGGMNSNRESLACVM